MEQKVFTAREAAAYLRLNLNTLAKWRITSRGPAFVRAGGRVLYRLEDLNAWLETQREAPAGPGAPAISAIPAIPGTEDLPHE